MNNHDVRTLKLDLQYLRYEHFNNYRKELLKAARQVKL